MPTFVCKGFLLRFFLCLILATLSSFFSPASSTARPLITLGDQFLHILQGFHIQARHTCQGWQLFLVIGSFLRIRVNITIFCIASDLRTGDGLDINLVYNSAAASNFLCFDSKASASWRILSNMEVRHSSPRYEDPINSKHSVACRWFTAAVAEWSIKEDVDSNTCVHFSEIWEQLITLLSFTFLPRQRNTAPLEQGCVGMPSTTMKHNLVPDLAFSNATATQTDWNKGVSFSIIQYLLFKICSVLLCMLPFIFTH